MPFLLRATPRQDLAAWTVRSEVNRTATGHSRDTPGQILDATNTPQRLASDPPSGQSALVRVTGRCLAAIVLGVAAIGLVGCDGDNNWRLSARVLEADEETVCLALLDDGPGYINNGCPKRTDVVGLPEDVLAGECLRLNQKFHADLIYSGRSDC